jgi:hypothetical protein
MFLEKTQKDKTIHTPGLASVSKAMDSDVSTNHVQMRTDPTASGVAPTARNVDHI